jgi:hypothetical protein
MSVFRIGYVMKFVKVARLGEVNRDWVYILSSFLIKQIRNMKKNYSKIGEMLSRIY